MRGVVSMLPFASIAGFFLSAGCASKPVDPAATGRDIKVVVEQSKLVELPPPSVSCEDGVLTVSGLARRPAGVETPLVGHVLLVVADKDGNGLKYLRLGWTPQDIPTTGNRESTYSLNYVWTPPAGSTLYVAHDGEPDFTIAGAGVGRAGVPSTTPGAAGLGGPGTIVSVPLHAQNPAIIPASSMKRSDEYAPMNFYFPGTRR